MMHGKIYLVDENEQLQGVMSEVPFDGEERLQRAIQVQPDLIPGDQIEPEDPRRWLLVKREAPIPDGLGASDRWSLDHLLVDQDSIPTLVECKNSGNSELRREVVAQMLDYAANIREFWEPGRARNLAEASAVDNGQTLVDVTLEVTQEEDAATVDDFWAQVDENLGEGRIRLVFAAPRIPGELQTIVDFLNGQMTTTDVVAVEITLYESDSGLKALVPRVTGRSAYGRVARRNRPRTRVSSDTLISSIEPPVFRQQVERVITAVENAGATIAPGSVGASWRVSTSQTMSLCWLFPSGSGWMGMRDLTLGVVLDRFDELETSEIAALQEFGEAIGNLPGNGFEKDWFIGNQFGRESLGPNVDDIERIVSELAERLKLRV